MIGGAGTPGRGALTGEQQSQLAAVLRVLEADEHAPTAVRTAELAARTHIADSLVALELDAVRAAALASRGWRSRWRFRGQT